MSYCKLHGVTVEGSGPRTMLMSHGFGCGPQMFRLMIPELRNDFRIVRYHLAGSGPYPKARFSRAKYGTLDGYAQDVIHICDEMGLTDVIHVGHSVSATVAGLAAIARPDLFSHLVMIGPSARYINDGDYYGGFTTSDIEEMVEVLSGNYVAWSGTMAPAIAGNAERPELGQELTASFCDMDPEIAAFFARVTFTSDNRADLPKITTPTLIIQSREDIIAPEPVGRYVHEHIPGSTFRILDSRGHCPNLSHPHETNAAIREFLAVS